MNNDDLEITDNRVNAMNRNARDRTRQERDRDHSFNMTSVNRLAMKGGLEWMMTCITQKLLFVRAILQFPEHSTARLIST